MVVLRLMGAVCVLLLLSGNVAASFRCTQFEWDMMPEGRPPATVHVIPGTDGTPGCPTPLSTAPAGELAAVFTEDFNHETARLLWGQWPLSVETGLAWIRGSLVAGPHAAPEPGGLLARAQLDETNASWAMSVRLEPGPNGTAPLGEGSVQVRVSPGDESDPWNLGPAVELWLVPQAVANMTLVNNTLRMDGRVPRLVEMHQTVGALEIRVDGHVAGSLPPVTSPGHCVFIEFQGPRTVKRSAVLVDDVVVRTIPNPAGKPLPGLVVVEEAPPSMTCEEPEAFCCNLLMRFQYNQSERPCSLRCHDDRPYETANRLTPGVAQPVNDFLRCDHFVSSWAPGAGGRTQTTVTRWVLDWSINATEGIGGPADWMPLDVPVLRWTNSSWASNHRHNMPAGSWAADDRTCVPRQTTLVRFHYTDADLQAAGISEEELGIWAWNGDHAVRLVAGLHESAAGAEVRVYIAGQDIQDNVVWAMVTHRYTITGHWISHNEFIVNDTLELFQREQYALGWIAPPPPAEQANTTGVPTQAPTGSTTAPTGHGVSTPATPTARGAPQVSSWALATLVAALAACVRRRSGPL